VRKLRLDGTGEVLHELERMLVSVRLRQGREACDVGKKKGCVGVPLHETNLIALRLRENSK
jgi:hypothetical protein